MVQQKRRKEVRCGRRGEKKSGAEVDKGKKSGAVVEKRKIEGVVEEEEISPLWRKSKKISPLQQKRKGKRLVQWILQRYICGA